MKKKELRLALKARKIVRKVQDAEWLNGESREDACLSKALDGAVIDLNAVIIRLSGGKKR